MEVDSNSDMGLGDLENDNAFVDDEENEGEEGPRHQRKFPEWSDAHLTDKGNFCKSKGHPRLKVFIGLLFQKAVIFIWTSNSFPDASSLSKICLVQNLVKETGSELGQDIWSLHFQKDSAWAGKISKAVSFFLSFQPFTNFSQLDTKISSIRAKVKQTAYQKARTALGLHGPDCDQKIAALLEDECFVFPGNVLVSVGFSV